MVVKEKSNTAHKATTLFIKATIDLKWDAAELAAFSTKLARYNVSLKAYQATFQLERSPIVSETGDDANIGDFSNNQGISMSTPPRNLSANTSLLPMSADTSPTNPGPSSATMLDFSQESRPCTTPKQRRKNQNQLLDNISGTDQVNVKATQQTKTSSTKNRIEPLKKPDSPLKSRLHDIFQSQEYPYRHI